jgi:hypothetical protein
LLGCRASRSGKARDEHRHDCCNLTPHAPSSVLTISCASPEPVRESPNFSQESRI